jgi:hypothetical protein
MKRFQLIVLLGLFSLSIARDPLGQKPILFRDSAKSPHITIQGNKGALIPGESFELSGNVQIKRLEEGGTGKVETTMTCAKATGKFRKRANSSEKTEVESADLEGGVQFAQSGSKGTTLASGDNATYKLNDNLREINLNGDVKVSFAGEEVKAGTKTAGASKTNSTMSTSSKSATLIFKTKKDSKNRDVSEIQSALVRGPIEFSGVQIVKDTEGQKLQKVFAKADQMTYTVAGESNSPEVRLSGNLEFRQLDGGDDGAVVEGATLLILQLNEKNEIVKLKFSADAGKQVKTTVTKNNKSKSGGA